MNIVDHFVFQRLVPQKVNCCDWGVRSESDWMGLRPTRGLAGFFYMVFPICTVIDYKKRWMSVELKGQ